MEEREKIVAYAVVVGGSAPISYWSNREHAEYALKYAMGSRIVRLV